jgi:hypothetical protein
MRIARRHGHFINKMRTQLLDRSLWRQIVRIACDRDGSIHGADEWCERSTCLQCVTMAPLWFENLKADVPCAYSDMVGLADAKIDVSDVALILCHNAKMVIRDKTSPGITRDNFHELQSNFVRA